MDASSGHPAGASDSQIKQRIDQAKGDLSKVAAQAQPAINFWTKVNNDWVFNLSGLLAYSFLMSAVPILLVLLAVAGFVLGNLAPDTQAQLQAAIAQAIPGGATVVTAALHQLARSAGVLLIIGVVTAAFAGSRLFITIENCFGIIFRLRGRDFIQQNLMAFGMLVIYAILIPFMSLASVIPSAIVNAVGSLGHNGVTAFLTQLVGIAISVIVGIVLFAVTYIVVPNRPVRFREVWRGTLVAAGLLVIYQILFPLYQHYFLRPQNYGSVAGFAIVILLFFYYLGFILLFGAEINSWAAGYRQTDGDIASIMHDVRTRGAKRAGAEPKAGPSQKEVPSDFSHDEGRPAATA